MQRVACFGEICNIASYIIRAPCFSMNLQKSTLARGNVEIASSFCCLLNTRMWKCRNEHFVFRTAGLPQYTFIAGNPASCFAILVLSDAHPHLGKIPPRIADQGHHIRASVGRNEFLFGNLGPLRHFHQCRCRNVRFQGRFKVILLRQAGASAVLGPLVYPKIIVLG